VLLDIAMPGMDGFELCQRLRKLPGYQKTPVLYVTANDDFENRAKGVLSGGDDLISKPVFPMDLAVKAVALLLKGNCHPRSPVRIGRAGALRGWIGGVIVVPSNRSSPGSGSLRPGAGELPYLSASVGSTNRLRVVEVIKPP